MEESTEGAEHDILPSDGDAVGRGLLCNRANYNIIRSINIERRLETI